MAKAFAPRKIPSIKKWSTTKRQRAIVRSPPRMSPRKAPALKRFANGSPAFPPPPPTSTTRRAVGSNRQAITTRTTRRTRLSARARNDDGGATVPPPPSPPPPPAGGPSRTMLLLLASTSCDHSHTVISAFQRPMSARSMSAEPLASNRGAKPRAAAAAVAWSLISLKYTNMCDLKAVDH